MNVKGVVNYSSLRLAIVVYFALMGSSLVHQSKSRASVVASQLNAISTLKKINITINSSRFATLGTFGLNQL